LFFRLAQIFFRIYFFIYHRVSVKGLTELKKFLAARNGKPVILAANHESYLDPPLVGMLYPRAIRFIAWDGLFKVPLFASLIRALGAVPVNQQNKNSAANLLRDVIGFIRNGYSVLIFPEGERSPDGNLRPLEGGVALIALKTEIPIVPVWIDGTFEAYPILRKFPRPYRVAVTFGEPIFTEDLPVDMPEKERRRTLLDSLEHSLEAMRDGKSHHTRAGGVS
jgi:1-acyl-sn-glycerol-3-phosphate acyltransferase